jgi:hypothetical protein
MTHMIDRTVLGLTIKIRVECPFYVANGPFKTVTPCPMEGCKYEFRSGWDEPFTDHDEAVAAAVTGTKSHLVGQKHGLKKPKK